VIIDRRRAVLVGGLALVGGCAGNGGGERAAAPAGARVSADPEAALRRRAARDSADLLVRYDATAAAHPTLAAKLAPLRAEVARHLEAFGGGRTASPRASLSASPSAAPSASSSAAPSPSAPSVPAAPARALAALAGAEQRVADARTAALLDAPPELARLLASVAAAGSGHVLLLGGAGGKGDEA
jgi:hypothetical protein